MRKSCIANGLAGMILATISSFRCLSQFRLTWEMPMTNKKKPFVRPVLREEAPLAEATLFFQVANAELLSGPLNDL